MAVRKKCSFTIFLFFCTGFAMKKILSLIFANMNLEIGCNNLKHLKLKLITLNHVL